VRTDGIYKLLRREIRDEELRRVSKGKDQVPVIPE